MSAREPAPRPRAGEFRKVWDLPVGSSEPGAPSRFSDRGHRTGPLAESVAWNFISLLLAGLLAFGLPGYLLDLWLGTDWIVGVGIVLGGAVALLAIWNRYGRPRS